ncbi:uncharacterized protein LOC126554022 [Aphis gossypii]|uniref:uncharacterized protein LOC126554022 n=1 Tax=Aphis gossypii TaxID=80765 RepID=UPI002158DDC0|nr:uncharacterized protein LOC126554022 [Aphis gossypii]
MQFLELFCTQSDTHTLLEECEVDNPLPYSSVSSITTDSTENSNSDEPELSESNFQSLLPCNMETVSTDSINEDFTGLHPDDPKRSLPTNRLELKDRILRGPFQPVLTMFPRSIISGVQRSFNKNWYEQFTWLEYSPKNNCAFCFPCRIFKNSPGINVGQSDTTFSQNGFSNWKMRDFLDLVRLLTKYDPILNEHFDSGPRNALYHSNRIQNDIIASINTVLKNKLKSVIKNQQISIIADETSDIGHHEQLSIVVRYYDSIKNCPVEQFVCMKRLLSTDAQSIFNTLYEVIEQYDIQWKSVSSVCFDGAAAMSGSFNGVQAKFKEKNDKTVSVHCYGHCLNLVLVDSLGRQNRVTFDFFGSIQLIYNFIESSCTRHATLEKVATNSANIKLKTLKSVSNTRWACRAEAVSAV